MERELFDWENWDSLDTAAMMFYNATLKRDIGPHKVGDKFPSIELDFDYGFVRLYDNNDQILGKYRISLTVGEEIVDEVGND